MFRQRGSKSDSDGHTAQRSPEKATADSGLEGEPVLRRRKHGHKAGADDSATGARGIKSSNNGKAAIPTAAINNSPPTGCCEPTREQKQGPHSLSDDRDSPKIGQLKSAESYFYGSILQREMGSLPLHKKKRMWFVVGIVFGIVAAFLGMQYSARYSTHLATIRDYVTMATADLDLGSLLPANVGMDELLSDISRVLGKSDNEEQLKGDFEPARSLRQSDPRIGVKHPVVLVPGIVSTGLESWSTMNCSLPYFRERMWGTMTMFKAILLDKQCWIKNVMLDLDTGMDPPE
ncbi:phospholipid:diacylglycerol acyltransferase, partial [Spiromyces aspiralis]